MFCSCGGTAKKYGRYVPDPSAQRWRCIECGRVFTQDRANAGNNYLPGAKRTHLKQMLVAGVPVRAAARALGVAHETARRYYRLWAIDAACPCGQPSSHMGFCAWRLAMAPKRQAWLDQCWQRRSETDIAALVREATTSAEAQGHQIGTWVWGASENAGLWPWTRCTVCGCGVAITNPPGFEQAAAVEGKALVEKCQTPEAREQETVNRKDKRQWQTAKRTLSQLRKVLRDPSSSPTVASTPDPISPP